MIGGKILATGTFTFREFESTDLPEEWDEYSSREKWLTLQPPERFSEGDLTDSEQYFADIQLNPVNEIQESNVTTINMHEYFAQDLDPAQDVDEACEGLALGNDDTNPSSSNTSLNNEVFRKAYEESEQVSNELTISTFIDQDEGNDLTFREAGLVKNPSADGEEDIWNHSTISSLEKDDTRSVSVDVTIEFTAA